MKNKAKELMFIHVQNGGDLISFYREFGVTEEVLEKMFGSQLECQ